MDTETLKSLVAILVWGGLFVLMMRFGCGAHVMGGHGHHGGHGGEAGSTSKRGPTSDPVCGMNIEPGKAAAAAVFRGETYYFCSASCRDKFEASPGKYAAAGVESDATHEGHHHG